MADIPTSFLYSLFKDVWSFVISQKSRRAKADIASREKWKEKIQNYLYDIRDKNLRDDIIVRDINRYSHYPEGGGSKGISPWFRAGLLELYYN